MKGLALMSIQSSVLYRGAMDQAVHTRKRWTALNDRPEKAIVRRGYKTK